MTSIETLIVDGIALRRNRTIAFDYVIPVTDGQSRIGIIDRISLAANGNRIITISEDDSAGRPRFRSFNADAMVNVFAD